MIDKIEKPDTFIYGGNSDWSYIAMMDRLYILAMIALLCAGQLDYCG